MPLIRMSVDEPTVVQLPIRQLEEVFIVDRMEQTSIPVSETPGNNSVTVVTDVQKSFNLIPLIYLAGFFVSLALMIGSYIGVVRIIAMARPVMYGTQRILVSSRKICSFTFAGWIVMSEQDYERFAAEIVTHETIHQRKRHFWDLCLTNVITVIHWFNPLTWLLQREIKNLHEYEADQCTLTQGIDATRYKLLLIEKAAGASRYSVASSFAQSKIKKRIKMMNQQNLRPWAR